MSDDGMLKVDPLFVGLTRPAMFFGVSVTYGTLNVLISLMYFIFTSDFKVVFVTAFIHVVGYIACFNEPLIIELYMMKNQKCNLCKNKFFHGAVSYDMY